MDEKTRRRGYNPLKIICKRCGKKDFTTDTGVNVFTTYRKGKCVSVKFTPLIPRIFCNNCNDEIFGEWLTIPSERWRRSD